jgi:excisionase family DNA binding protein
MQLSHADIMAMPPEEAARELADTCSKLPLLIARAGLVHPVEEMMTVGEVAQRLGCSESFVRMQAASNQLWTSFAKKIGKHWRFKRAEFERIVGEGKSRELL